jgi:hypothetical protein
MSKLLRYNSYALTLGAICLLFSLWLYVKDTRIHSFETLAEQPLSSLSLPGGEAQGALDIIGKPSLEKASPADPIAQAVQAETAREALPRQAARRKKFAVAHSQVGQRQREFGGLPLSPIDWSRTREANR